MNCSWADSLAPTSDDINKYLIFHDKIGKKYYSLEEFSSKLVHMRNKTISLYVHKYSLSVCNATVWKSVKLLVTPTQADRAGASRNQMVRDLATRLKELYQDQWTAPDIHWTIWANQILSSESHMQEQMITQGMVPSLAHLFSSCRD